MGHADTGEQVCPELLWTFGCRRGGDSFPMTLGMPGPPETLHLQSQGNPTQIHTLHSRTMLIKLLYTDTECRD